MGMAMASRQNIHLYYFLSQMYLTAALTYLGLGYAALFVTGVKSLITLAAHFEQFPGTSLFINIKILHPVAWVLERLISTPARIMLIMPIRRMTGVGNYKGNFGNMFFIWDVIFGTALLPQALPVTPCNLRFKMGHRK